MGGGSSKEKDVVATTAKNKKGPATSPADQTEANAAVLIKRK